MRSLLRKPTISILVFAVLAISSCEKDNNGHGADKQSLLTSHIWKFGTLTTTSTDIDALVFVALMEAYKTGTTLNFTTDGHYAIVAFEDSETGTWELNADGTKLTLDDGTAYEVIHDITSLTSDVLEYIEAVDGEFGSFDMKYSWVK